MVQIHTEPGMDAHETVKLTFDEPDLDFNTARDHAKAGEDSCRVVELVHATGLVQRPD